MPAVATTPSYEQMKDQVTDTLRQVFRPEFLNRIDEIIVFHALTDEDLAHIVELLLADLSRRLADNDLELDVTPAARSAHRQRRQRSGVWGTAVESRNPAPG